MVKLTESPGRKPSRRGSDRTRPSQRSYVDDNCAESDNLPVYFGLDENLIVDCRALVFLVHLAEV